MKNNLTAFFDINPSKSYSILQGATYTETFNEEINSMNIVLDGVKETDRLYFDRPYHFVKIVNNIPNGETGFKFKNNKSYVILLVDTFVETLNNIGEEKFYRYEIQLMNCVKLLEKIQCPNLVITHNLNEQGSLTLWDCINKYMKMYSPKIKKSTDGTTWSYQYLLDWSGLEVEPFTTTYAADMQMNEPTLRQVITNLMLQVGRIPSLDYLKVESINFREEPSNVTVSDTDGINFISHSGASDSYADTLVQTPTQTLDDENEVMSELISFRDSDSALIQQTNNLQIEVRYPIYKINEILMRVIDEQEAYTIPVNMNNDSNSDYYPIIPGRNANGNYSDRRPIIEVTSDNQNLYIKFGVPFVYSSNDSTRFRNGRLSGITIHLYKYDADNQTYNLFRKVESPISRTWNLEPGSGSNWYELHDDSDTPELLSHMDTGNMSLFVYYFNITISSVTEFDLFEYFDYVWFESKWVDSESNESLNQFVPMSPIVYDGQTGWYWVNCKQKFETKNDELSYSDLYSDMYMPKLTIPGAFGAYVDITPIVLENRKRRLLDTDYKTMYDTLIDSGSLTFKPNTTLYDLGRYLYGTLGYNIGDNKITGFSETFSRTQLLWNINRSYFDNIIEFIQNRKENLLIVNKTELENNYYSEIKQYLDLFGYSTSLYNLRIEDNENWMLPSYSKMKFLFYVNYKPLNNFKFKSSKEGKETPFNIEQLNQSEDGLSDYSRLVLNVQDTVNRIGNPVKSLPQTTNDISKVKPLNGIYNDGHYNFTIFHRQFSIYEDYINVTYTASENYVIKNYFTSIITKYRAYQYVDYNEAVTKKENLKIYALISDKHYYDGDDHVILFNSLYTFNDLKEILGVQDLTNYVNYDDTQITNYLNTIGNFGIKFCIEYEMPLILVLSRFVYKILPSFDISYDLENVTETQGYTISPVIVEPHTWDYYSDIWSSISIFAWDGDHYIPENVIHNVLEENKSEFKDFIISNISGTYMTSNKYNELLRMNGSIIQDGDNYYRVHIVTTENNESVIDSRFAISKYEFIEDLITEMNNRMQEKAAAYINYNIYYHSDRLIEDIHAQVVKFYIYLESLSEQTAENIISSDYTVMLSGLKNNYDYYTPFKYVITTSLNENDISEDVKNECSVLLDKNGFNIHYEDYDNVSGGIKLKSLYVDSTLGGYLQKWQIWKQDVYNKSHEVAFCYRIKFKSTLDSSGIEESVRNLPVLNRGWEYRPYTLLQIVDNNKSNSLAYTFEKDNAEVINQTVQFEYYADKNDIIWSDEFIKNNRLVGKIELPSNSVYGFIIFWDDEFKLKENYDYSVGHLVTANQMIHYDSTLKMPYIEIPWTENSSECYKISFAYLDIPNNKYHIWKDFMAFKRNGRTTSTKYYLTLNDTKTNDVWYFTSEDDLFENKECANGINRYLKND